MPSDEYSARQMKLQNERKDMLDRKLTYPSTDAPQTNSKNLVPSDEYGARQMKLLNERKDMLDRELTYPSTDAPQTNSKNLVPSDEYSAKQMKLLNERKDMLDRELTYPSTDAPETNSENLVPSDEYSARQMKLQNERKDMLDRKLTYASTDALQTNSKNLVPSDEYSARQMKLLNERKDMLDRELTYPSTSTDALQTNPENLVPSDEYSARQMKLLNESKDMLDRKLYEASGNMSSSGFTSNTYVKTKRRVSFQDNRKTGVFTNVTNDMKKETGDEKDSLLSVKLKSVENGPKETVSVNKSRRGSLVREKRSYTEEKAMPAINSSSRKGPLKKEKRFVGKKSIPAVRNKSGVKRASLNNKTNLNKDKVKHATSNVMQNAHVKLDEDGTKNGVPSECRFTETSECLSKISQSWMKIRKAILAERQTTEAKLKQYMNNSDSETIGTKGCDPEKLLAALCANDGEEPSIVNPGDKHSSILDTPFKNSMLDQDSSLNISLPFTRQMRVLNQQQGKVTSKERKTGIEQPKTKPELM
jgi:hypothetical protein